jgi:hypothetical protein
MKIIIIGGGWYGLHIAYKYQHQYKITILEKKDDIFTGSSYNNQNRLHLGYHYPRSYDTRQLCKNGFEKFVKDYLEVVEDITNNYYLISNNSIIDYNTYKHIFEYEGYVFKEKSNILFNNIQNKIFEVDEKLINHKKAKNFFKENLTNINIIYNYNVVKIEEKCNKIYVNDDIEGDIVLNCTYGQFKWFDDEKKNNSIYEKTISYIYKKIKNTDFDCITIMDGNFASLFIKDKLNNTYSLTHVKYTPLISSTNINDILQYNPDDDRLNKNRKNMENDIKKYFPLYDEYFKYDSYILGYKIKKNDNADCRTCDIYNNGRYISVNGGKITGIYQFFEYVDSYLELFFGKSI